MISMLERFASTINKTLSGSDFNKTRTEKLDRLGYNIRQSRPVNPLEKKTAQAAHAAIRGPVQKNLAQAEISRATFRAKIEQPRPGQQITKAR